MYLYDIYGLEILSNVELPIPQIFVKAEKCALPDLTLQVQGKRRGFKAQIEELKTSTKVKIEDRNYYWLGSLSPSAQKLILSTIHLKMLQKDCLFCHGACLTSPDGGIVICGPSESGKTSSCIRLALRYNMDFVSDDRFITDGRVAFTFPDLMVVHQKDLHMLRSGTSLKRYLQLWTRLIIGRIPYQSRLTGLRFRIDPTEFFQTRKEVKINQMYFLQRGHPSIQEISSEVALHKFVAQNRLGLTPWLPWFNNIIMQTSYEEGLDLFSYAWKEHNLAKKFVECISEFFTITHDDILSFAQLINETYVK